MLLVSDMTPPLKPPPKIPPTLLLRALTGPRWRNTSFNNEHRIHNE